MQIQQEHEQRIPIMFLVSKREILESDLAEIYQDREGNL